MAGTGLTVSTYKLVKKRTERPGKLCGGYIGDEWFEFKWEFGNNRTGLSNLLGYSPSAEIYHGRKHHESGNAHR